MTAYLVDAGVLLGKDDPEYEAYAWYDKEYGYYDTKQYPCTNLDKAIEDCRTYVTEYGEGAYGIVTELDVSDDQYAQIVECEELEESTGMIKIPHANDAEYARQSVVYSIKSYQGKNVENFIKT